MKNKRGFSLVELMIVIVIIGILAAVAVPIYSNNVLRAKVSEADAALGSIRTQLRVYYSENGEYPIESGTYVFEASWGSLQPGELTGQYFRDSSYTYTGSDGETFTITCATENLLNTPRTLTQDGVLAGGI